MADPVRSMLPGPSSTDPVTGPETVTDHAEQTGRRTVRTQFVGNLKCQVDLGTWSETALGQTLLDLHRRGLDANARVAALAQVFLGTPFEYESKHADLARDCVYVCLRTFDCVTFIFHVLALARARDFAEYVRELHGIRYKRTPAGVTDNSGNGTLLHFACEALLEQAITCGVLVDVTADIAQGARLMPVSVTLQPLARPAEHDATELIVHPVLGGERAVCHWFIPTTRPGAADVKRVRSGDIVIFTLGAVNKDGTPRHIVVRHAAIAMRDGPNVHFIHSHKNVAWRPDNRSLESACHSGRFLLDDPRRELIGVGYGGEYAGDELTIQIDGVSYFAYDQTRRRSVESYGAANFVGVKFLRPCEPLRA